MQNVLDQRPGSVASRRFETSRHAPTIVRNHRTPHTTHKFKTTNLDLLNPDNNSRKSRQNDAHVRSRIKALLTLGQRLDAREHASRGIATLVERDVDERDQREEAEHVPGVDNCGVCERYEAGQIVRYRVDHCVVCV